MNGEAALPDLDRLEFRFRWDKSEHRRLYRTVQLEARRGSKTRWFLNAWFGLIAGASVLALIAPRDGASTVSAIVPLAIVVAWVGFDRWGLSYLSARSYERDHAPCIPNDQVRVLSGDGIAALCTTSNSSVRWAGIVQVQETPEFFLFFTTPACAIQLPKRAVGDQQQLRTWLNAAAERSGLANIRMEPPRR
jgi:hypothetical protein